MLDLFTPEQIKEIKEILSHETRLTPAECRLKQCIRAKKESGAPIVKAQIWGVFDGYNSEYREYTLGGIVNDNMERSTVNILTVAYETSYEYGQQLRRDGCERVDM